MKKRRRAEDQIERLPALAADLAGRQVSLILAAGSPAVVLAAKSVTTSIPIVFNNSADPVKIGLVASLNRPGGNVTGVTTVSAELEAKRLVVRSTQCLFGSKKEAAALRRDVCFTSDSTAVKQVLNRSPRRPAFALK